jgi:signal transduction histidine kinase
MEEARTRAAAPIGRLESTMVPRRAPWPLLLASLTTWAVVGVPATLVLLRQPDSLTNPLWVLRIVLYFVWPLAAFGATWGELGWNEPRRVVSLVVQAASALGLLWTAPNSPAIMLLFPVAGEAPFLLPLREAILLVAVQTVALAGIHASLMEPVQALVTSLCTVGGEIFGLGAGHLAVSERRARQKLAQVHAELQATQSLLAESVREGERMRISRDLHDTLGHHLTGLSVNLEVASHLAQGKVAEHVVQAHKVAKLLLADVRDVVDALHQDHAIDLGGALALMIAGVPQPKIHLAVSADLGITDSALAHAVFRCVQEIVTNTVRHADARNLWIEIRQGPGGLSVEARDDGRGAPSYAPGHGLTGMGERLRELGGGLVVASHPGRGFEVRATLPMPQGLP